MNKTIKLGIFGYGCVGQGLYHVLNNTNGIHADIKKICIKDNHKIRNIDADLFTTDRDVLLNDPEIDVIVELINDSEAAFAITKKALMNGKSVVSANKKMIAENLEELILLQNKFGTSLLYEGSCCASIPIIRNLEEYYDNDLLKKVEGIFNGTSNYILTKIFEENLSFATALKQAQDLGFAETDPSSDIDGFDSKFKLCIILLHSFGIVVDPTDIFNLGISRLNDFDIAYAKNNGYRIKLIARCQKIDDAIYAYCIPQFIKSDDQLFDVKNEYNGVVLESAFSDSQSFVGKGAGSNPTGSAVLSDISALSYKYQYEYKKRNQLDPILLSQNLTIKVFVRFNSNQFEIPNTFFNVSENYQSNDYSYFIAEIKLVDLKDAEWLKNKEVNVVMC